MDRGNQYVHLVKVLYSKLLTISKQLPTFPHRVQGLNHRLQRWEASVLLLPHRGYLWCSLEVGSICEKESNQLKWAFVHVSLLRSK